MKVKYFKTIIDLFELQNQIDIYTSINLEKPSYIIMNYKTSEEISDQFDYDVDKDKIERLYGIPVAYNKNLENGEIDFV